MAAAGSEACATTAALYSGGQLERRRQRRHQHHARRVQDLGELRHADGTRVGANRHRGHGGGAMGKRLRA